MSSPSEAASLPHRLAAMFAKRFDHARKAKAKNGRAQRASTDWLFPELPESLRYGATLYTTTATKHRDRRLPPLYLVQDHPRRPEQLRGKGRDFVYGWNSQDGPFVDDFRAFAKSKAAGIPKGPNHTMAERGLYGVQKGDMIWVRDYASGNAVPMDDVLQAYIAIPAEFGNEWPGLKNELDELRDGALGPREQRSRTHVRFEDSKRARPVHDTRCYNIAISHQRQRNMCTPSAGTKMYNGDSLEGQSIDDRHAQLCQKAIETLTTLGVRAYRLRQPEEYNILNDAADLYNTPRIGYNGNCLFTGGQMNLATPHLYTSEEVMSELKTFGLKHNDGGDALSAMSTMISNGDLPEGYEGGRFHLVELGIYIELDGHVIVGFSGLRWHGGTPPLAPKNILAEKDIEGWAYRWVFILYPQRAVLDGGTTFNVAANEDHTPFQVTAEMRDVNAAPSTYTPDDNVEAELTYNAQGAGSCEDGVQPDLRSGSGSNSTDPVHQDAQWYTPELNFASEGHVLMPPQSQLDFTTRSLFLRCLNTYRQLSGATSLSLSYQSFADAFKVGGLAPAPWALAPNGSSWIEPATHAAYASLDARQKAKRAYQLLSASNARFIVTRHALHKTLIDPPPAGGAAEVEQAEAMPVVARSLGRPKNAARAPERAAPKATVRSDVERPKGKGKADVQTGPIREALQRKKHATLLTNNTSQALMKRASQGVKRKAPGDDELRSSSPKRGRTTKTASSSSPTTARSTRRPKGNQYFVKSIVGHRITKTSYEFLCVWEDSTYPPEHIPGKNLSRDEMFTDYCSAHQLDLDVVQRVSKDQGCPTSHCCQDECGMVVDGDIEQADEVEESDDDVLLHLDVIMSDDPSDVSDDDEEPLRKDLSRCLHKALDSSLFTKVASALPESPHNSSDEPPEPSWPDSDIPFLSSLSPRTVDSAARIFEQARPALAYRSESSAHLDTLWKASNQIESNPQKECTAVLAAQAWPLLSALAGQTYVLKAEDMALRFILLRMHHSLSVWLVYCATEVLTNKSTWVHRLLRQIRAFCIGPVPTSGHLILNTHGYLPSHPTPLDAAIPHPGKKLQQRALDRLLPKLALQVACTWFQIPALDMTRARFLRLVESRFSEAAFLLEEVWLAYQSPLLLSPPKRWALGGVRESDFTVLERKLDHHPLTQAAQLTAFSHLRESFMRYMGMDEPPPTTTPSQSSTSATPLPMSTSSHRLAALSHLAHVPTSLPFTALSTALPISHAEVQGRQTFAAFMRDALCLLTGNPADQVLPRAVAALADLDRYLPFRELAPSRRQILSSPAGPFSTANISTRQGLFSALLFRGVLFSTDALFDGGHSFCFENAGVFDAYRQLKDKPERYFCHPGPYGVTKGRSTAHAERFWESSSALLLKIKQNPKFLEFIQYVTQDPGYPTFGSLCAYLLAVDLVYAGAIPQPEVEELGEAVAFVNKGAATTLIRLGCPQGRVKEGFVALCRFLETDGLSATERAQMSPRFMFDVEHGLCKYGRFYRRAKSAP